MINIINSSNKYLTKCNKNSLIKMCKKLKIIIKLKLTKIKLINKINNKLLNYLSVTDLILINNQFLKTTTKQRIKNKKVLIKRILYYTAKYKKYNNISIYLINKSNRSNNSININNSSFGITCEYIICKLFNLEYYNHASINYKYNQELMKILSQFKTELHKKYSMKCIKYIGNNNHATDFLCKHLNSKLTYTLSVKSNMNSSNLVCPQIFGQCSYNTIIKYIKNTKNIIIKSKYDLKKYIIKNLLFFFNLYYKYLFCCDYLLWIKNYNNNMEYNIISKQTVPNINQKYLKLNLSLSLWKSSNILKYKNHSIGIFYFHNTRNVIQFRFYLTNLLKLINNSI